MIPGRYHELSPSSSVLGNLRPYSDVPQAGGRQVRRDDIPPPLPWASGRSSALGLSQEHPLGRRVVLHSGEVTGPTETHRADDTCDRGDVAQLLEFGIVPDAPCV